MMNLIRKATVVGPDRKKAVEVLKRKCPSGKQQSIGESTRGATYRPRKGPKAIQVREYSRCFVPRGKDAQPRKKRTDKPHNKGVLQPQTIINRDLKAWEQKQKEDQKRRQEAYNRVGTGLGRLDQLVFD